MERFEVERIDGVLVARLNHGITNAMDRITIQELAEIVQQARDDPGVGGLVLASANEKFFTIGFDIPQLYELNREEFVSFYRLFNQTCLELFTLPKPTVAALTGHAIAGGSILALCCDYRFIAQSRKLMGLNEIKLGAPVPYLSDCILRSLIGPRLARDVMESGEFYPPEETLRMGMVDEVLPLKSVVERAVEKARNLSSVPAAYASIKRNRVEGVEEEALRRGEEKERQFVECWYSEDARARLREAMEKF